MKREYVEAFMDNAERFGMTSKANRLKVGALLVKGDSVIAIGINGQPPGWPTEVCEDEHNVTLPTVRHAEIAAFDKLVNSTETAKGSVMFVSHAPCIYCAIKIKLHGITKVYYRHVYRSTDGIDFLRESGIEVEKID